MSITSKLIFDIETIGVDFDALDETTQDSLTRWIKKESNGEEEYQVALEELKNGLGFSPLTGEIIAIGVLDYAKNQGVVYFNAPGQNIEEFKENNITFKQATEKEMLEHFWSGAKMYDEFIGFSSRQFDGPFLMIRSAYHDIRPTRNLSESRYVYQQKTCTHIDLIDQLTFQGNMRKKGSLHLWSKLFNIKSPKEDGVTGDDVGRLFKEKKFLDIARYNAGDLKATKELYDKWNNYLNI
ncbi:MAG: ribonuclease H-like domain-containing protein [Patescibacteria group bacterium]